MSTHYSNIPDWRTPFSGSAKFVVYKGGDVLSELVLNEKLVISFGRKDDNDVIMDHTSISRYHAVVFFKDSEIFLMDLGSSHGTHVDDVQLKSTQATRLDSNCSISFGKSTRNYVLNIEGGQSISAVRATKPPVPSFMEESRGSKRPLEHDNSDRASRQSEIDTFVREMTTTAPSIKSGYQRKAALNSTVESLEADEIGRAHV